MKKFNHHIIGPIKPSEKLLSLPKKSFKQSQLPILNIDTRDLKPAKRNESAISTKQGSRLGQLSTRETMGPSSRANTRLGDFNETFTPRVIIPKTMRGSIGHSGSELYSPHPPSIFKSRKKKFKPVFQYNYSS